MPRSRKNTPPRSRVSVEVPCTSHPGDAARSLIEAVLSHGEGTWVLQPRDPEAPSISVEVKSGWLVDIEQPGRRSILHRALLKSPLLRDKDISRLERLGLEKQACPGSLCLDEGIIDPDLAGNEILKAMDCDLLLIHGAGEGSWHGPLSHSINSGLRERVELGMNLEQALLRSAREHQLWETIVDLPLMREVVSAAPTAMTLFADPGASAEKKALIESADGQNDIAALTTPRPDPWRALDRVLELLDEGHLQFQSAMSLFHLGEQKKESGDFTAALRHWRRAEEKGLDDFDLGGRIGELCAETGRVSEGLQRLRVHAKRCTEQLRWDAARTAWTHLVQFDPSDKEACDRAIQLWKKEPAEDLSEGLKMAQVLIDSKQWQEACDLLDGVGARVPDARVYELHEIAAQAFGDIDSAYKARWRRAECLRTGARPEQALEHYQYLEDHNPGSTILRVRLAEALLRNGNIEAAGEILQSEFVDSGQHRGNIDEELFGALHSCEQQPEVPGIVREVLFVEALQSDCIPRARNLLRKLCASAISHADFLAGERVTQRWLNLEPSDIEVRSDLLELYLRHGKEDRYKILLEESMNLEILTHDQRQKMALDLLELDPSHPKAVTRLLHEPIPESLDREDLYRRALLRATADGSTLPKMNEFGLSASQDGRWDVLTALFSGHETSLEDVKPVVDRLKTQPNLLQDLLSDLLESVTSGEELSETLGQLSSTPEPVPARQQRVAVVRSGVTGITEKLKNLGQSVSDSPSPRAEEADFLAGETVNSTPEPAKAAAGVQSSLDRLKAMRGASEPVRTVPELPSTPENEDQEPLSVRPAPPPVAPQPKVSNAIARLGALRSAGKLTSDVDVEHEDP